MPGGAPKFSLHRVVLGRLHMAPLPGINIHVEEMIRFSLEQISNDSDPGAQAARGALRAGSLGEPREFGGLLPGSPLLRREVLQLSGILLGQGIARPAGKIILIL